MAKQKGKLYIISGPGGVGKDTLVKMVRDKHPELKRIVTYAAREPRAGEVPGEDYHFVSEQEFERMIQAGELLEYAKPRGNYYGTPLKPIKAALEGEEKVLMHINVDGVLAVQKLLPNDHVSIFLIPPDIGELKKRMRERGNDDEEGIQKRLEEAKREIEIGKREYDHQVVNPTGHPERAVEEIEKIIYSQ